ncbi:major facilitator superfamily domain-containing protein [Apodospora peruviana]|uniref:Major facilitator superfamily domain-containing protein n=1 Tax=Apodospora peruviana TaxID=516989 RepID=A0AAE0HS99_9PEZI|nr:major facilitator superfamily domain-containing protein [Apodospora peruviana]KAK3312038.1 major facilitator superfamily domain-containing protein [Apodospora peruviana]
MAADENTPLLAEGAGANGTGSGTGGINDVDQTEAQNTKRIFSRILEAIGIENRILLAGFLITLSFSFTQVPIFYVFYLMECDDYYTRHPPFSGPVAERCNHKEIAAGTAEDFALLAMSTTFCGTLNLFVTGWVIKKVGPRLTLILQTFIPAIRVATQILGVLAGGRAGIIIFQCTQFITIIGGPVGYILVINIIVGEVVTPARRTAVFGMLQGCLMLGQGVGYLTGGMIGDKWGIRRPFEVAFCSFLISVVYAQLTLPYISPESMSGGQKPQVKGIAGFFAPLKVLSPQIIRLRSGMTRKHYGVLFLCLGVFIGVLATDYAPLLIQLYATTVFHFNQGNNGFLMSEFALMRAMFLLFGFPRIIGGGRKWYLRRYPNQTSNRANKPLGEQEAEDYPTHPEQLEAPMGTQAEEEPIISKVVEKNEDTQFDLFFLRWSLIVDGALTMCAAFATEKWHIYLAAFALPLGSGTAPAAKGVITEMCSSSQRADALNALTLVENIGRLATQGLFGFVFAAFATLGKPHLTFFCNAAIALLAVGVLLFSSFPPDGSKLLDKLHDNQEGDGNSTEHQTLIPDDREIRQRQEEDL